MPMYLDLSMGTPLPAGLVGRYIGKATRQVRYESALDTPQKNKKAMLGRGPCIPHTSYQGLGGLINLNGRPSPGAPNIRCVSPFCPTSHSCHCSNVHSSACQINNNRKPPPISATGPLQSLK